MTNTPEPSIAETLVKIDKAQEMVDALCKHRGTEGAREWIMSIPARPDYDPDLVIDDALRAAKAFIASARPTPDGLIDKMKEEIDATIHLAQHSSDPGLTYVDGMMKGIEIARQHEGDVIHAYDAKANDNSSLSGDPHSLYYKLAARQSEIRKLYGVNGVAAFQEAQMIARQHDSEFIIENDRIRLAGKWYYADQFPQTTPVCSLSEKDANKLIDSCENVQELANKVSLGDSSMDIHRMPDGRPIFGEGSLHDIGKYLEKVCTSEIPVKKGATASILDELVHIYDSAYFDNVILQMPINYVQASGVSLFSTS